MLALIWNFIMILACYLPCMASLHHEYAGLTDGARSKFPRKIKLVYLCVYNTAARGLTDIYAQLPRACSA